MLNNTFRVITLGCTLFFGFSCANHSKNKDTSRGEHTAQLNRFLDSCFNDAIGRDPVRQSYMGIKKDYDKWTSLSDEHTVHELEVTKRNLEQMKQRFDTSMLDIQGVLSYRLYEQQSQIAIDNFKWRFHSYPVNQMDGLQSGAPAFLINIHQIKDTADALAYISRVKAIKPLFNELIVGLKVREEKNIIPPRFVFPMVIADCKSVLRGQPFEKGATQSTLLDDFTKKLTQLKDLSPVVRERFVNQLSKALIDSLKPAYEQLENFLVLLEKKATDDDGAWKFPDGDAYYEDALKTTTTTNLTADEIHEIGLKEVARIQNEMRAIMKQVHFKSDDLQEFFKFMKTDKQFYYANDSVGKKAYLQATHLIIDSMYTKLDKLFVTLPKAKMEVKAVEPFREKSTGGAFYEEPAMDGSRPGRYYVNLFNMNDQANYQMEALAYHEAIPGHHMQTAIALELENVPQFRKVGGNTAYIEGWALYTEQLGKEVGFYKDPYSDFGRLSMELFRAGRLVVDTGIHKKKWKRKQALDYFIENVANPEGDSKKEIDRYIIWPSQATGYKIGMIKIVELREKAKKQLGDKFDIRQFHDVVLTNGPVPLTILEELVDAWVKSKS